MRAAACLLCLALLSNRASADTSLPGASAGAADHCAQFDETKKAIPSAVLPHILTPTSPCPRTSGVSDARCEQARALFDHRDFAPAAHRFCAILETKHRVPDGHYAVLMLLASLDHLGAPDLLQSAAERYCGSREVLGYAPAEKECTQTFVELARVRARRLMAEGSYYEAGRLLIKAATDEQYETELASEYYEAGVAFARAGQLGLAIQAYNQVVTRHPSSPLAEPAAAALRSIYAKNREDALRNR